MSDEPYDMLKQPVNAHHRSVNSELIHCLQKPLKPNSLAQVLLKIAGRNDRALLIRAPPMS